jgi:hypothetical protein
MVGPGKGSVGRRSIFPPLQKGYLPIPAEGAILSLSEIQDPQTFSPVQQKFPNSIMAGMEKCGKNYPSLCLHGHDTGTMWCLEGTGGYVTLQAHRGSRWAYTIVAGAQRQAGLRPR